MNTRITAHGTMQFRDVYNTFRGTFLSQRLSVVALFTIGAVFLLLAILIALKSLVEAAPVLLVAMLWLSIPWSCPWIAARQA